MHNGNVLNHKYHHIELSSLPIGLNFVWAVIKYAKLVGPRIHRADGN